MHPSYSTITPRLIHREARQALGAALPWQPFHDSVRVPQLLDLLLLMAAHCLSLFAAARRFFPFSHETARKAVHANLPDRDRLTAGLVQALHDVAQFSRRDRRRYWLLAIDTHNVPYYGRGNAALVGGPKQRGTKWSYSYATAVLLHKRRRYTVALSPVFPRTKPHEIVRTLLGQIADHGLRIRGVALDSAFDSGETLLLLQERGLAYVVPLRRKGNTRNARNRYFEGRHRLIRWVEWTTETSRRRVRTRTLVWHGAARTMVFAFQGWSGERARNIHQWAERQRRRYRQRFGIETSYRQKNQARASTSSSEPVYRLLLEGLGYLLRQVWVVLTEDLAHRQHLRPSAWVGVLTLQRMLDWLLHELTDLYPEDYSIPIRGTTCAGP